MRARPITFKNGMVAAILDGRKTQTRRVLKPQPVEDRALNGTRGLLLDGVVFEPEKWAALRGSPYGRPGERLWVREAFAVLDPERTVKRVAYAASWPAGEPAPKWTPALFMPRWASRLTLEIRNVRVERVQEISPDDAEAEGAVWLENGVGIYDGGAKVGAFKRLWQRIGGEWEANPWVWVIDFRMIA